MELDPGFVVLGGMAGPATGGSEGEGKLDVPSQLAVSPTAPGGENKGKGILVQDLQETGRRMVLVGDPDKANEEDEDEYVFEEDVEAKQRPKRWMAIARFYSGKAYSTWGMFKFNELSAVWGKQEQIPVRELGNNRFLVEFNSEKLWSRVIGGGPWKHKRDAVIFVPYDGICRFFDVVINSITLWIRIYDIPESMITEGFARALGAKLGKVLEVEEGDQTFSRAEGPRIWGNVFRG